MEQFKIKPEGFKEIRKQMLVKTIPLAVIAVAVGLGVSYFNPNNQGDKVNVMPIVIPVAFGAVAFGLFRGVNRQKQLFQSYCLTISETGIVREQKNTPTISLSFSDINEILKNSNGSFTIKGRTALDVIGVPAQIDNYQHLETTLNQIRPLNIKTIEPTAQKLRVPLIFLTLGLFAIVYLVSNKIIVGISGTTLTGILIYSFIQIQRNKNIDSKTKRSSYWVILVLFSVIAITIFKLTAH